MRSALAPGRDLPAALAAVRSRPAASCFAGVADVRATIAFLDEAVGGWREGVVRDADRIRAGTVRPLGRSEAPLTELFAASAPSGGQRYPWHDDGLNDHRWSDRTFFKQVPMEVDRADLKVPWELSRFQHLTTLGVAYRVTGDEAYAAEAVGQIDDWIARNPLGYGVNWVTSMEVAIRAVNWLWAFELLAPSEHLTDAFLTRLLASLVEHGEHIAENLEIYEGGLTTNHTLADYAGLCHLGLRLPELRQAEGWADSGLAGLDECMRRHVNPDGGHFENSLPYHRLVLEMLLSSHVLAERAGRPLAAEYAESLRRMVEFTRDVTRPDGLVPLVGDSDDGRYQVLARYFDWDPQDHRYLLALGGALFDRDGLATAGRDGGGALEEVAWLLGPEAARRVLSAAGAPEPLGSRGFPQTGRYVMRSRDAYALVSADEAGTDGLGNHKHNDILGFELSVRGEPVVVDRGTFVYQSSVSWRDRFRSTRAHSTVMVGGVEQNGMRGTFWMPPEARVVVERWDPEPERDVFAGHHTGYERLAEPVRHERTIVLEHEPFAFVVLDSLGGAGEHDVESFVQLDPRGEATAEPCGPAAESRAREAVAGAAGDRVLELHPEGSVVYRGESVAVAIVPIGVERLDVIEGWHAPRYGQRVPATVAVVTARVEAGRPFGYAIVDTQG